MAKEVIAGAVGGLIGAGLMKITAPPPPPQIDPAQEASYIIYTDGSKYYAKNGRTERIEFSSTNASTVIQEAINRLVNGGIVFIKDIDPATFTITSIPNNVLVIISHNGTLTLMKPGVNILLNNFGRRGFEIHTVDNTIRLRDTTPIDLFAVDPVTGDIHFFVNASVDNMNPAGFLGRNNLPPGYRLLNKNSSPVKVFDLVFRNDGILSIRTGDPTIDGQSVVDRLGVSQDGRLYRLNMPPPGYVSPIPTPPYRPDVIGAVLLYFVIDLRPTPTEDAVAVFDISPDNITWFNAIAKAGIAAGGPSMTQTIVIYVPSGWYVRWTLTNAFIVTLFKQYI
jgi:hypothetical protein